MKEFTHDEKVALLRGLEPAYFDACIEYIAHTSFGFSIDFKDHMFCYLDFENCGLVYSILVNVGAVRELMRIRSSFVYVMEHRFCKQYARQVEEICVSSLWPQYCPQGQNEVLELPELGDVV